MGSNKISIEVDLDTKAAANQLKSINKELNNLDTSAKAAASGMSAAAKSMTQMDRDLKRLAADQQKLHDLYNQSARSQRSQATSMATLTKNIRSLNDVIRAFSKAMDGATVAVGKQNTGQQALNKTLVNQGQIYNQRLTQTLRITQNFRQGAQAAQQQTSAFEKMGGALQGMGGVLAAVGLANIGDKFIESAKAVDQAQKMIQASLSKSEDAGKVMSRLVQIAQAPGLNVQGVVETFARLKPVLKDTPLIEKFIANLGNEMAKLGKGGEVMNRVGVQFGQMAARGKVAAEDLRFIQAEMPTLNEILLRRFGTIDPAAVDKAAGSVRAFFEILNEEMSRSERMMGGVVDQFDNLQDQMTATFGGVGKDVITNMKPMFGMLTEGLQAVSEAWNSMPPGMKATVSWIIGLGATGLTALIAFIVSPTIATVLAVAVASIGMAVKEATEWSQALRAIKEAIGPRGLVGGALFGQPEGVNNDDRLWAFLAMRPNQRLDAVGLAANERMKIGTPAGMSPEAMAEAKMRRDKEAAIAAAKAAEKARKAAEAERRARAREIQRAEQEAKEELIRSYGVRRAAAAGTDFGPYGKLQSELEQIAADQARKRQQRRESVMASGDKRDITKDATEATRRAEAKTTMNLFVAAWAKFYDEINEHELKLAEERLKLYEEGLQKQKELFIAHTSELLKEIERYSAERQEIERAAAEAAFERAQDARIRQLEIEESAVVDVGMGADRRRIEREQHYADEKLKIELDTIDKQLQAQMELLEMEKARAKIAAATNALAGLTLEQTTLMLNSPSFRELMDNIDRMFEAKEKAATDTAQDKRDRERDQNTIERNRRIAQQQQRMYESLKDNAGRVFDALLTKSSNVFAAIGNIFKTAMLTAIREVVSSQVALMLMRLLYGGAPATGGSGGGPTNTGMGGWRGILGGFGGVGTLAGVTGGPGGTGGFAGPVGATGGRGGLLGGAGGLLGLGGFFNKGFINMGGGYSATASALGGVKGAAAGFASSGMGLGIGATLATMGVARGGKLGLAMTAGGGALAGFAIGAMIGSVGGPLGMAIGAAIGGAIGTIRLLMKSATDKAREKVKQVYSIDITSKQILGQIAEIAKTQFGGNLDVAIYSPVVRELVMAWSMATGANPTNMGRPMLPVSFAMSGGSATLQPVYSGANLMANPYIGPTTSNITGSSMGPGGNIYVQLNPAQANQLFEGRVVKVIENNGPTVADVSTASMEASYRRSKSQNSLMEPLSLL